MGWLTYGTETSIELDDASLVLLDALISRTRGRIFQLHLARDESQRRRLRAFTVSPGVPIVLEYADSPDLQLSTDELNACIERVDEGYFVELPMYRDHDLVPLTRAQG